MTLSLGTGMKILGLGLDAAHTEKLKAAQKIYRLKARMTFCASFEGWNDSRGDWDAILVQAPTHFAQALKLVQSLIYRFPRVPVIVATQKNDPHLLVHFFRAGASDVLLHPFDELEMAQVLRRVYHRPQDMAQPGSWTPLQAAAHYFTRPIAEQWDDLADNLHRYFSLFIDIKERRDFTDHRSAESFLKRRYQLKEARLKRLQSFLRNPKALFFGIEKSSGNVAWLTKLSHDFIGYWQGSDMRKVPLDEVFGTHFVSLLQGQREHHLAHIERERMRKLALTDEITGLWNQRKMGQDLEEKVLAKTFFTLMFIDIDFFKNVNDQFGHVFGSQLLLDMAAILRRELRGSDLIYRYGGDEFVVLLPATRIEDAKLTALRLSNAIKEHEFSVQGRPYRLSLSVGLAEYPSDAQNAKALINFADQMMYMSKKSGRGKVFHVTEVL